MQTNPEVTLLVHPKWTLFHALVEAGYAEHIKAVAAHLKEQRVEELKQVLKTKDSGKMCVPKRCA